jgi:DNA invertase Pin-like site-specific DNA recombinase
MCINVVIWYNGSCTLAMLGLVLTISTRRTKSNSLKKQVVNAFIVRTHPAGRWDRPELHKALDHLRRDDVLIVWKLDRLSRSLSDLLRILQKVDEAGAKFKSLTEAIDTTTPMGRMVMQVVGSFAEFERSIIKERTKLGLARARANGRIGGGRYKLSTTQQAEAIKMIRIGEKSQAEIAELFNVDRSTISRMMKEVREKELLKTAR